MDIEVYNIIKYLLNENNLKEEYDDCNSIINSLIEENNITTQSELILYCIDLAYNMCYIRSKFSNNTKNLLTLVYCKLYFDRVLKLDDKELGNFIYISNVFKGTQRIDPKIHSLYILLYKINVLLETSIKFAFSNYNKIPDDLSLNTIKEIKELLNSILTKIIAHKMEKSVKKANLCAIFLFFVCNLCATTNKYIF